MPRPPQTLAGRIWVGSVTTLIAFIAYSSQIFIIWPWYGRELTVDLVLLLVPFNLFVAFLYWNYFLTVFTDPGGVKRGWEPDITSEEGFEVKALTGQPRYCRYCESYKPPRTHHCKSCKRCVLRMDHHCPWTDNCIGHFNYSHFLRFLWAVDIACSYHLIMISWRVYHAIIYPYFEPSGFELGWLVANYVACIPVLVAVGVFSLYHFYCLFTNTTTVESWEKDKVTTLVRRGKISEVKFPYNLGMVRNFTDVMGSSPLLWCWPLRKIESNGMSFPVAAGVEESEQYSWPPKDPYRDKEARKPHAFADPWTFGNGDVNPTLRPTNSHLRKLAAPPYASQGDGDEEVAYPDELGSDASTSSSPERESHSSNEYPPYQGKPTALVPDGSRRREGWLLDGEQDPGDVKAAVRVRRGSEGWETTTPDRWAGLDEDEDEGPEQDTL